MGILQFYPFIDSLFIVPTLKTLEKKMINQPNDPELILQRKIQEAKLIHKATLIHSIRLKELSDKTLVFDGNALLYRYGYNQDKNHYIIQLGWLVADLKSHNINSIFVFDGKPDPQKAKVNKKRKFEREKKIQQIEDLEESLKKIKTETNYEGVLPTDKRFFSVIKTNASPEMLQEQLTIQTKLDNLKLSNIIVNSEVINTAKTLLSLMGMQIVDLKEGEGEQLCSFLNRAGLADYVVCDDADVFAFGAKALIRGFGGKSNREANMTFYDIDKLREIIGLNDDEFIDFCILCGCDFTDKIGGIGRVGAYKYIKQFGCIEEVLKNLEPKYCKTIPENFEYQEARQVFKRYLNLTEIPPNIQECFWPKQEYDHQKLIDFLVPKFDYSQNYVRLWTHAITGILPQVQYFFIEDDK